MPSVAEEAPIVTSKKRRRDDNTTSSTLDSSRFTFGHQRPNPTLGLPLHNGGLAYGPNGLAVGAPSAFAQAGGRILPLPKKPRVEEGDEGEPVGGGDGPGMDGGDSTGYHDIRRSQTEPPSMRHQTKEQYQTHHSQQQHELGSPPPAPGEPLQHADANSRPQVTRPTTTATATATAAQLSPCHICHRRPTKKSDLDQFADCQACGQRTCFVCIRECMGWGPHDTNDEMLISSSYPMRDAFDENGPTGGLSQQQQQQQQQHPQDQSRQQPAKGGHRQMVCSGCCVERGPEGDVVCLGCLPFVEA